MEAKKNSTAAAGRSRRRGVPATLKTAAAAPVRIGSAYTSSRGGSFTVSTSITL